MLAMTLLVRDEEDVIATHLDYHYARGVDLVIATDNGSVDGTLEILRAHERRGRLRLLHEPAHDYAQSRWVTRMARLAAAAGADWVINSDADEFWWPLGAPDLAQALAAVPPPTRALRAQRHDFPPRPPDGRSFFERMTIRRLESRNCLGRPLPPKIVHRADAEVVVAAGNHRVRGPGFDADPGAAGIEILHFPIRTYEQFAAKIVKGATAVASNPTLDPAVCRTWRWLHELWRQGRLREHYEREAVGSGPPPPGCVEDGRLRDFLRGRGARAAPGGMNS